MKENKLSWNAIKKNLWKLDTKDLMVKLQEIETEVMKQEILLRTGVGERRAYSKGQKGNLGELKRRIACIKTMIHTKMLGKK